MFSHYLF